MTDSGFRVVIPARYDSTRLPGKVLREIAGRTMLEHVWRRACASGAREVVIAADDERVEAAGRGFGADVRMTRADHASGTDRIDEIAQSAGWDASSVVVNVQGDEPELPAALIRQVGEALQAAGADIATTCVPIECPEDLHDPNVVKVVRDAEGFALYFSRAPIPWDRDQQGGQLPVLQPLRHIGIYAYRVDVLRRLAETPSPPLERCEALEQLRAQWLGLRLRVTQACEPPGRGVDTMADLEAIHQAWSG